MNSAVDLSLYYLSPDNVCTKEQSKNAVSLSCYFSFISTDRQTHLASGYWLLSYLYLFSFLQTEFCLQDICSKEIYCIYLKVRQVVEFLTCGYKNWLDCCKSICVQVKVVPVLTQPWATQAKHLGIKLLILAKKVFICLLVVIKH